jgi:DNA invertase Pin-like site-specific DNA recombinase
MRRDKLLNIITSIQDWCKENEICVFYGTLEEKNTSEVSWTKTSDTDWEQYLKVLQKSGTKIIIINTTINDIDLNDDDVISYKDFLEEDEIQEYDVAAKTIENTKGQIAYFQLTFIIENVCYNYSEFTDWVNDYFIVIEAFSDDDTKERNSPITDRLTEEEIEKIARIITSNERYLNTYNSALRSEVAKVLLRQEYQGRNGIDIYKLERRIETIFEIEIRPKKEKEIKNKVLDLKEKNYKKVEIASTLGISSGMVNKYYYTPENNTPLG